MSKEYTIDRALSSRERFKPHHIPMNRLLTSSKLLETLPILLEESKRTETLRLKLDEKFNLLPVVLVPKLEENWMHPTDLDKTMPIRLQQSLAILAHMGFLNGDLPGGLQQVDEVCRKSKEKTEAEKIEAEKYRVRAAERKAAKRARLARGWNGLR